MSASRSHSRKTIFEILKRDPVHPFPARMAPEIALEALARRRRPLRVLDPMAGSGTVLAVARSRGHRAVGVDVDPLAVLISRVWTTAIDAKRVRLKAIEVLRRARELFKRLCLRDAYPPRSDEETRRFVRYWFDDYAQRQLACLATSIRRIHDGSTRDVLWCAFSRLIITKQAGASLAMDLSHSRPHKSFKRAPKKPFRKFLDAVDNVLENCIDKDAPKRGPSTRVYQSDARSLPLSEGSVDLVLTSPPYLNAIDYLRCSKFSLVWMGHSVSELREVRAASIGTEVGLDTSEDEDIRRILSGLGLCPRLGRRDEAILGRYVNDMRAALKETVRVLAPEGRAVYVIGENTIRGTYVPTSRVVRAVAESLGLELVKRRSRVLPANRRYLPPPSRGTGNAAMNARMRREVVLTFRKWLAPATRGGTHVGAGGWTGRGQAPTREVTPLGRVPSGWSRAGRPGCCG